MIKDGHIHYSGSLPINYIHQKLISYIDKYPRDKELINNVLFTRLSELKFKKNRLSNIINTSFTDDFKSNYNNFFNLYNFIQILTKPKRTSEIRQLYKQGTSEIISCLSKKNINQAIIFAGPVMDLNSTYLRFKGMTDAFRQVQTDKYNYKIRLTFISKGDGSYSNLDKQSIEELLDLLIDHKEIAKYIDGFDFSGSECIKNLDLIVYTINRLNEFKKEFTYKYKSNLTISVHAGENFGNLTPTKHTYMFDTLLNLPIDNIGHGIFLWIPHKCINFSKNINKERFNLLMKAVKRGITFEICPTSNVLFSPLNSYQDIPINYFNDIGLKYTINSDNMTILNTDIYKETKKVNRIKT